MRNALIVTAIIVLGTLLSACHSYSVDAGATRTDTVHISNADYTSGLVRGTLGGQVVEFDYKITWIDNNHDLPASSGATVSIDATNYRTLTNSTGHWSITDLPAGNYTLTISKAGFSSYKIFNYGFAGRGPAYLPRRAAIARIPFEYTLHDLTLSGDDTTIPGVIYNISPPPPSNSQSIVAGRIFAGPDSTVSSDPATYRLAGEPDLNLGNGGNFFSKEQFARAGFKSGDRVYVAAYLVTNVLISPRWEGEWRYWNPHLNQYVNPALNPVRSNVVSFILP